MKSFKETVNQKYRTDPSVRHLSDEELEKLKHVLLEIYLDIQAVCDKYGLVCMLLGGSALGAVRHKGFIPWDDDLDIGMPRDDYEIFIILEIEIFGILDASMTTKFTVFSQLRIKIIKIYFH